MSFGILERYDCRQWAEYILQRFGYDTKIVLYGISMGASTVLMASDKNLPSNVVGILADCGFHSAKEVICAVAKSMHFPSNLLYPFVNLGARLFGRFDLEELTAVDSVCNCKIPVLFFHGEEDHYVPSYMSQKIFNACASRKKLVVIPGAAHGLSFPVDPNRYITEMKAFFYENT